jgi:hypothetical protein
MWKFVFLILFSVKLSSIYGQENTEPTKLYIIGVKHNGNEKFNYKTLYKVFDTIKPDLILWEQSTKFKRVFALRTATYLGVWKPSIEQLALQKFSKRNKNVQILPFDTTINAKGKFVKDYISFDTKFFESLITTKKHYDDSLQLAQYLRESNYYLNTIMNETLEKLNRPEIYNLQKTISEKDQGIILSLAKKYLSDTSLIMAFQEQQEFWILRNNYMVRMISNYAVANKGKKIVILTGLSHKYFLVEKLSVKQYSNLKLLEFY